MNEPTLQNCRILVVEDEYLIADELRMELEDFGAVVLGPVARVGDAIELIAREKSIDGAVLDVNLGGEMVYPVADFLIKDGIPFIFTTGYDAAAIPQRFDNVVRCEKPVEIAGVAQAIRRLAGS